MKDFQVTMRMKDFFFDRRAVTDRLSKANKKALAPLRARSALSETL